MTVATPMKLEFPAEMRAQNRWLVRVSHKNAKVPRSPLPKKPDGYVPKRADEHPNAWRSRWNQPCVWAPYDLARRYYEKFPEKCDGLTFVLHAAGETGVTVRYVCLDFDNAFDADGNLYPEVRAILEMFDSYVE